VNSSLPKRSMEFGRKMLLARFAQDERSATAIEHGLIAAGISVVLKGVDCFSGPSLFSHSRFRSGLGGTQVYDPRPHQANCC
jgi:hypothetical protein